MPDPTVTPAIVPADDARRKQAGGDTAPGARPLQTLCIGESLPGLNEIIAAHGTARVVMGRRGKPVRISKYDVLKKRWGGLIATLCRVQRIQPVRRAQFTFCWTERNKRRDPDNIAAGGRKLILDGLVTAGVLANDGWEQVAGWSDLFMVGAPGVVVYIAEVE